MNEEWFGICGKGPTDDKGLYELHPRAAYYALKDVHALNPYKSGNTAETISALIDKIDIKGAEVKARGKKASLPKSGIKKSSKSGASADQSKIKIGESLQGNFLNNDDFETGNGSGWLFFQNNGNIVVTESDHDDGKFSAKVTSLPASNPGIKQERFGAGAFKSNQEIEVSFDVKATKLADGATISVLAFSESRLPGVSAVLHNLGSITSASGTWESRTFTFTTADDVSDGVSLLVEVVCGRTATCSGEAFFDNVSLKVK